jgi:NTP pyrophosphatase (non-canonical NTP hydrolase)
MDRLMALTKWVPTTDLMQLRRFGKLLEECGELVNVAARCIIQGIDETDPGTQRVNRVRLEDELADVTAQIATTTYMLDLDESRIHDRILHKCAQMTEWEAMFDGEVVPVH